MKSFTFRQYRRSPKEDPKESAGESKDKDNATYLKRREQVRRAQRTHRERKEAYIKSLENEVLQLRTNEAKILQETRGLYTEVGRLKRILEHHGIPYAASQDYSLPSQLSDSPNAPSLSSVSILSNPHQQQQLHIGGPEQRGSSPFYLTESDGSPPTGSSKSPRRKRSFFRSRGRSDTESNEDSSTSGQGLSTTNQLTISASNLSLRDMDQTNVGMEFVLTLEAPCLHHTQGDPHEPHLPSGHALTASAPLLFQNPTQPVITTSTKSPSWEAPHLGLEKLLNLSSNFELSDELTPVQAWHQIRSHPDFESIEVPSLRRLTEDMLKHVKCYGFGAVIDTETFEGLVGNLFGGQGFNFGFMGAVV
ncbi:uncharacterized protein BDR25DRAFT_306370 [Lindgomyces ingoldianus]|uniref:Uncharacterized protein n=1 Tax=Lindgomyces ingoldianus TaxID=673940 RepID=A0ACB6QG46_9PLEO|nr:uncharacterized protein BDR25DRAFT_306370 [Lindgomyces ingoldianus]KAF2465855.1 hypothetical protein BDR25DRAFT_306370 [Lindgomyces ingoldianus]